MRQFLFALLLLAPVVTIAQRNDRAIADSMIKALGNFPKDTSRVRLLYKIAYKLQDVDPEAGIKYGNMALALAQDLSWKEGQALANSVIGINYKFRSEYTKALEYYFKALKINEELGIQSSISANLGNIGTLYNENQDPDKALEYYERSLKIDRSLGNKYGIAVNLGNIGTVYVGKQMFGKAIAYTEQASQIQAETGDKKGLCRNLANLGSLYTDSTNYELALEYFFKSLPLAEELGFRNLRAIINGNIGNCYSLIANDTVRVIKASKHIPATKGANLALAATYFTKGIEGAKEIGQLEAQEAFQASLAEVREKQGNYMEALSAYKEHVKLKDSMFSDDNKVKLANLATEREALLKERQITANQRAREKEGNTRLALLGGFAFSLVIAGLLWRGNRRQKKSNVALQGLVQEKEMLMKEIHHRVKNNLQVISTLLEMQLNNVTDEKAKDAMSESNTRVRSISLIHHQLYQHEDVTSIEFGKFAGDLERQVRTVFKKPGQDVTFESKIPETVLDIDTAVPLGLVLNELLTNSYKYAFSDAKGAIAMSLTHTGGNYELRYNDSGSGLPVDMDMAASKSLGMRVIRGLSKQMGGQFKYDRPTNTFLILFKDSSGRKESE